MVFALVLIPAIQARAYFAPTNHEAATMVLGQSNFTSSAAAATKVGMNGPFNVAVDPTSHKVFVVDTSNNRVLRFASVVALANGAAAQAVLGQPTFTSHSPAATQSKMNKPGAVFVDAGGRLWVADTYNNRVLRFDHAASTANGAKADGVLGQADFTHGSAHGGAGGMSLPFDARVDAGGRLWVADTFNNRVLRFDGAAARANGSNADGVLGQPDFTSTSFSTTQSGMYWPYGVVVDASGRLWVADAFNNRVLRFNAAASKANGANADGVLGQANFTSAGAATTRKGMSFPTAVAVDSAGRLYVADFNNSRVTAFNGAAGMANGANASFVLGQSSFTTGTPNTGGISASSLNIPWGVYFDPSAKVLWVADTGNNRVLLYGKPSRPFGSHSTAANDGWVLESTETSGVGGSMSAAGTLFLGDDAANNQYRSIVSFDTSALPDTAVIRSVTLKIKKAGVVGTDPLTSFGFLLGDIKKGAFGAAGMELTDFQSAASASITSHFTAIAAQPGWYQLVVPAADYSFVNLAGLTQFRLRFSMDDNNNNAADYDSFFAGDAASAADRPSLSIECTLP
jgi:DNA-binding beta-propeller fold protein YncE